MSNKTQLLARLRDELGDTGTTTIWTDGLLNSLLGESTGWYSKLWPMQATGYRDVASGQRTFDVPPGALGIAGVECPPGRPLPQEAGGTVGDATTAGGGGRRQSWSTWGGVLYLGNPASGAEIGAARLVMRVLLPWDRLDPVESWNGPEDDERLLVLWSAAEAWAWLDGHDQRRGRPIKVGNMAARTAEQLSREIEARRKAAVSRRLEVG